MNELRLLAENEYLLKTTEVKLETEKELNFLRKKINKIQDELNGDISYNEYIQKEKELQNYTLQLERVNAKLDCIIDLIKDMINIARKNVMC